MSNVFKMLVADMRQAQKEYFSTPRNHFTKKREILDRAKQLEKLVDEHLALMDLPGNENNSNQMDIIKEINKSNN